VNLTQTIANKFLATPDSMDFSGFTSIDDAAAKALAQHKGELSLGGLTSLSDAAAKALAQHKGYLSLGGLTSLSDVAAKALASHKGGMELSNLEEISDQGLLALGDCWRFSICKLKATQTKRLKKLLQTLFTSSLGVAPTAGAGQTKRVKRKPKTSSPQPQAKAPPEWVNEAIVLTAPESGTYWCTQSSLLKHAGIPNSLFKWFTTLLPADHRRDDNYGYYLENITAAAAALLISNRAFFEELRKTRNAAAQKLSSKKPDLDKIRKLITAGNEGSTLMAINMLDAIGADENDWVTIWSKTRLNTIRKEASWSVVHALFEAAADRPAFLAHLLMICKGKYIVMRGSGKDLSEKAATALAKHKGHLHLYNLTSLSDAASKALANFKGMLCLPHSLSGEFE